MSFIASTFVVMIFSSCAYIVFGGRYWEYASWNEVGPVLDFVSFSMCAVGVAILSLRRGISTASIIAGIAFAVALELTYEKYGAGSRLKGGLELIDGLAVAVAIYCIFAKRLRGNKNIDQSAVGFFVLLALAVSVRALKYFYLDHANTVMSERFHAEFFFSTWCVVALSVSQVVGYIVRRSKSALARAGSGG